MGATAARIASYSARYSSRTWLPPHRTCSYGLSTDVHGQLAVISYDRVAAVADPPLTAIHPRTHRVGAAALADPFTVHPL